MNPKLSGARQQTYNSIFHHPISHNIEWHDLRSMFQEVGQVVDEHNGKVRITRNGHSLVVQPPGTKEVPLSLLMEIRHFLRLSGSETTQSVPSGEHVLVVIDHHEARIFKSELHGAVPQKIVPYDPHGFGRHLHNVHDHTKGQHHPVPKSFFEDVAKTLQAASQILMFGTGSGGGSAMNELLADLHKNHLDIFEHVIGAQVVDETHLSEEELLSKAREVYGQTWGYLG